MIAGSTTVDEMAVLISKNLEEYQNLAAEELKKAVKRAGKTVREEIQSNAPVKSGRYSKSWKTKIISENGTSIELVVYSKDRYMLAHLLENGHAKRGGGRVRAIPHIKPAEEKGLRQLEQDLSEALKA